MVIYHSICGMNYQLSGCSPIQYPTELCFGFVSFDFGDDMEIPYCYPFKGIWGKAISNRFVEPQEDSLPKGVDLVWFSIIEKQFYSVNQRFSVKKIVSAYPKLDFEHLILGMAPYGKLAIWLSNDEKSVLVDWIQGNNIEVPLRILRPNVPNATIDSVFQQFMVENPDVQQNLIEHGLPLPSLYERKMAQFSYRYIPVFAKWDEENEKWNKYEDQEIQPIYDALEESLTDGTHDKLNDGSRLKYHQAGLPEKVALSWHVKKSDYHAYFWFDEEILGGMFRKISMDRQQSVSFDLIIRVDAERKKYEVSLYRYGMEKPLVVPETVYQYIVFKSKFENSRSENYDQASGAWIW